jgi:hypothetical protein
MNNNMGEAISLIIGYVAIIFIVFLVIRNFLLWYWKVNDLVEEQKKTNFLIAKLLLRQGGELSEEERKWLNLK